MAKWPVAPLGDVLRRVSEAHQVQADQEYPNFGIFSFGRGLFHKQPISGATTSATTLYRVRKGQFIYSRLFAFEGAYGLVTDRFDAHYVSNEYPAFETNAARLLPQFLAAYVRWPTAWENIAKSATGMGDRRRRVQPEQFLRHEMPLPPVDEQQRVVRRIEALAAQIREARSLRQEAAGEGDALLLSVLHRIFVVESQQWSPLPMARAIDISDKQVDPKLPVYSKLPHISGENIQSKTCQLLPWQTAEADGVLSNNYLFSPGTILYSKIRPYLRKAAFVDFQGLCSADVYHIRVSYPELDPHFVKWTLVAEPFTEYANRLSGRTRMPKLNRKQLFAFPLTHPALADQRRIVSELDALQAHADRLKQLQTEAAAEIDALLPAVLDRAFKGAL